MRLGVPSGVGDISWIVSKLINAPEWLDIEFVVADGWPYRADQYLAMLNKSCSYGDFEYCDLVAFANFHQRSTWTEIKNSNFNVSYLEANQHLESGKPLSSFLPDLPTSYHYQLDLPDISHKKWFEKLNSNGGGSNWIGISASSYRGHRNWGTWSISEWLELCKMLVCDGYKICLVGSSWDDLTRDLADELDKDVCLDLTGRTSLAEACAVQTKLKFFIGFCSGLGILRTVMSLPAIMLFPENLDNLQYSWADPEDVETKKYIASHYSTPKSVIDLLAIQETLYGN